ncbi:MAG: endonuclease/exonuclease/phosphatase family protein [Pseudoflavonifractor sp.]|nr:endonuclease/exonuclease/phosphatase family protein [Alloprevotella sp.]MCM1117409.1 endonuclease/exonuclease/phosphatase family protein [Pseudoflavonifractor sp.]
MRKIFLTVICMAIAALSLSSLSYASSARDEQKAQYRVFGVAFYNLENLFDTINANGTYDLEFSPQGARQWDSRKYWSKINRLASTIAAMTTTTTPQGPAVIGVSEIENESVLRDLVAADPIKARNYQIVHHDSPDRRGVDVSLLYNPRFFTLINETNHRLDIGYPTRDQMCVVGTMGGDTVAIIVNHWPSRLGGQERSSASREAAAALSKHIADSLWQINPNIGVIIMGDLNDDPHDKSCAEVLDARRSPKGVAPHGFYNPWWATLDKGIGTLAYKGNWNLFDQIIVSGNLLKDNRPNPSNVRFWKHQVNNFDFLKDSDGSRQGYPKRTFSGGVWLDGYSDHFPTEIFLLQQVK